VKSEQICTAKKTARNSSHVAITEGAFAGRGRVTSGLEYEEEGIE
jgi:hypothetical protein